MNNDKFVDTIHLKTDSEKDTGYGGSLGAPVFKLGDQQQQSGAASGDAIKIDSDNKGGDNESKLMKLSKEDLVKMMQPAKLGSKKWASVPKRVKRSHSQSSDNEEGYSDSKGSYSDSSSGLSSGTSVVSVMDESGISSG